MQPRADAAHSRFVQRVRRVHAGELALLDAGVPDAAALARLIDRLQQRGRPLAAALRVARQLCLERLAVLDVEQGAPLEAVTGAMTDLAETTLSLALQQARADVAERAGTPRDRAGAPIEFWIVGMGKLGARELNVSSDIDLIYVYDEDGQTDGAAPVSAHEYFARVAKRLHALIGETTDDGFVFRVDLALRPHGNSGPPVTSLAALEDYFQAQGREWERFAWLKSRVVAPRDSLDTPGLRTLRSLVTAFVYRRYLDYGVFEGLRQLHRKVRDEAQRRAAGRPERANDVKLSRGGIREIEFVVQLLQVVRGGQYPEIRTRSTLAGLSRLAASGLMKPETAQALAQAYELLRRIEHRIQYLDDAHTHDMPEKDEDRALIAEAMGFADYAALLAVLDAHREVVSRHFDSVFGDPSEEDHSLDATWANARDTEAATGALGELGYRHPRMAAERLAAMHASPRYRQLPNNIKSRFDALMPRVLEAAASTPGADETLARMLDLIEAIGRRGAYLALLQQYPQALRRVADLMSASRWGAQFLTRHPILLDEMLDARSLDNAPDWKAFRASLAEELEALEPDMERQMDVMRERHHAQVFRLLTQDLAGLLTVEKLADHLSELADIVLDLTLPLCWRRIKIRHREAPKFAVISYGKLGGKELGYASDLDIVFLHDDEAGEAPEVYTRLAQRVSTWLSSQTAAGQLFETDLRLRPNGESGLLVSSLESFR
ncbi:MAG: bifunctional [glutamate--ammonia ligase]-adenylyl-L-tyrosine phosphorylase/[glutamate--ammonia-ligase] adenylyltransferase, partial [Rubrivivax sp.]|nr:bifunctional [glutamate--ammonia ligase]-adenylyl-L-tyrosine phosphorylase/[glutamate--ammonia-ligase] adenylyltransferase [Rubrivivax sp.]